MWGKFSYTNTSVGVLKIITTRNYMISVHLFKNLKYHLKSKINQIKIYPQETLEMRNAIYCFLALLQESTFQFDRLLKNFKR